MPYLLEMVTTGKVIEVTKKYSYWYHKRGMKRGAKKGEPESSRDKIKKVDKHKFFGW